MMRVLAVSQQLQAAMARAAGSTWGVTCPAAAMHATGVHSIVSSAWISLAAPVPPQEQAQASTEQVPSPVSPSSEAAPQQPSDTFAEPLSRVTSNMPYGYTMPEPPSTTAQLMSDVNSTAPLVSQQFASSTDDFFGVQKNWFTALYKQLNYLAKTGTVPKLKGRQREVFEQVEKEFEVLYHRYIRTNTGVAVAPAGTAQPLGAGAATTSDTAQPLNTNTLSPAQSSPAQPLDRGDAAVKAVGGGASPQLDAGAHRAMLMCCLSIATYRVLQNEIEDTRVIRDVIRTNLGSAMISLLRPVHRFKLWILSWLLREDMYHQALAMLPALREDMGTLCESQVEQTPTETQLVVTRCAFHEVFTQEDAPFLLSEFCCHHSLLWLHEFRRHGVLVSMDQCKAWDDGCCKLRIARPGKASVEEPVKTSS
mmetsp:Transcript_21951/g.37548  ORF Transcript_21951/g.37548 Transcript_21951/m.37548 type:complete len:422 (-) Transcript_21951:1620-2885(-)